VSRPGSRRRHQRFCEAEGWELVRNAQRQALRHHITYELALGDGGVLRTRISRPANAETYGPALWSAILGPHQLDVTEAEFWACVEDGITPVRPGQAPTAPAEALPAELVFQLLHKLKLPDAEVSTLTHRQAVDRMTEFWSRPPS
jgi:hypothetical protein